MNASDALQEEVEKFNAWAALFLPHQRTGEWECGYDHWQSLWDAAMAVLESLPPNAWNERCRANLLYAIARDNEMEWIAGQLAGKPEALLELARLAIDSSEPDTKWQVAVQLGALSANKEKAEALLLRFVDDEDEYVSRRALLALGALKSAYAERLAEKAWLTGHEYQRIAALWVLKDVAPSKLVQYVRLADEDGRQFVVENAHDALKASND
ncbi:HEAT repeat domain-containing protein [Ralstonia pseudosolanacearum]|uniref:HEAT repeat domain-containing protein n=1 Tax=Ralstonia pseudosolanacearum TaxID=1310165 RepID=UPI0026772815|nr:HEAT repeat domain-containing protein [Ralstonia pseudosolanacearum]MDO3521943.1 HEAT repeat domain-containing protein [Ralstonia pseudosolanacearum]